MDISNVNNVVMSENIQSMYAVKCLLMARQSDEVVGNLLQDVAEISHEAMEKYLSEIEN